MGLFRNVIYYLTGSVLAQLAASARGVLLAKVLVPAEYGLYIGAVTFQGLAPIACLGTVETLLKETPFLRGRGDSEGVRRLEGGILGSIIAAGALLVIIEILAECVTGGMGVAGERWCSRMAVIASAASLLSAFHTHRCVAREDFKLAGVLEALRAFAGLVGIVLLGWLWKGVGAVAGLMVVEAIVAGFALWRSHAAHGVVRPTFHRGELVRAVRIGFPITVVWWLYMLNASTGRVVAGLFMGAAAVGLFGFAASIAMLFNMIPNVVGRVTYPRINRAIGESMTPEAAEEIVLKPTRVLAMVWPVGQIALWFSLRPVLELHFAKYLPALGVTQILILASYFSVLVRNGANYLVASNAQGVMLRIVLTSLGINVVVTPLLVWLGLGVVGIGLGGAIATVVLVLTIWRRVGTGLGLDGAQLRAVLAGFGMPLLLVGLALGVTEASVRLLGAESLTRAGVGLVLALAIYLGGLTRWGVAREDLGSVLKEARAMWRRRFPAARQAEG